MKRSIGLIVTVLLAAIGALLLNQAFAQNNATTSTLPAAKVATCDVIDLLNSYQRVADAKRDFDQRGRDLNAELETRQKAIEAIQSELKGLNETSKEYQQRFDEMTKLQVDLLAWKQFQEQLVKRERHRLFADMYNQALDAVEAVAKEQGADIVLLKEPRNIKSDTETELLQQISQRKVLYATGSIDLTDVVLKRLNETYKAKK